MIERVAASEQFSRSARLRDFLLYVGRQSLKEGRPEIHEQEIGSKVFGRPDSYDRSADNIVRVNATELRKRIEAYFALDGAKETLIFEIPRGGYKPVFRRRQSEPAELPALGSRKSSPATSAVADDAAVPERGRSLSQLANVVWLVVCLSLAITCAVQFRENRTMKKALDPWENQPAVASFWTGFLDPHRQTDLVLPDDSASVMEDISNQPLTLGDYMSRGFIGQIQSSKMSADRKEDVYQVLNHNLVTFGAVRAAQMLLRNPADISALPHAGAILHRG